MPIIADSPVGGDRQENLRLGARRQYTSPWTLIVNGVAVAFEHGLGEVPWRVSVIRSEASDGAYPVESNGDVTIAYTDLDATPGTEITHLKITNNEGNDRYFQVRAL